MKHLAMTTCILAMAVCGCEPQQEAADLSAYDEWLVNTVNDTAVRNAIIRQRTLFPYHFVAGGAALNDLGTHDVAILASHFKNNPGQLSVRRGDTPRELYAARVAGVADAIGKAGIDKNSVKIYDSPASGDGMPSEWVLIFLHKDVQKDFQRQAEGMVPTKGAYK